MLGSQRPGTGDRGQALFGVPMLSAGLITGLITFAVLGLQARGRRRFELAIVALLGLVTAGFLYETLRLGPSVPASLRGLLPGLHGAGSLYLAVGILGATVMPHVIYLHSAMTKDRTPALTGLAVGRSRTPRRGPRLPPRGPGSSPRRTRRAAGSSGTCTMASSSAWSRWRCC